MGNRCAGESNDRVDESARVPGICRGALIVCLEATYGVCFFGDMTVQLAIMSDVKHGNRQLT